MCLQLEGCYHLITAPNSCLPPGHNSITSDKYYPCSCRLLVASHRNTGDRIAIGHQAHGDAVIWVCFGADLMLDRLHFTN